MSKLEQRPQAITAEQAKDYQTPKLERDWRLVTGRIMISLESNPNIRRELISLVPEALSQELAIDAITAISKIDPSLADLPSVVEERLLKYLKLPELPEEIIENSPDVVNANGFVDESTGLVKYGLTWPEKRLVLAKYKFARDIKALALAAELMDNPPGPDFKPGTEFATQNGCKIFLSPTAPKQTAELIDPLRWLKRIQIKDRVYSVQTKDGEFILKERKTKYHEHTKKHGHRDGRTSKEEFDAASDLNKRGRLGFDDISFEWEQPLGYVEFPDGYQFTIFKKDPYVEVSKDVGSDYGLGYDSRVIDGMAKAIVANKASYKREYESIAAETETKNIYSEKAKTHKAGIKEKAKLAVTEKVGKLNWRPVKLGFEEYATVKAFHLYQKAADYKKLLEKVLGYESQDHDGILYYPFVDKKSGRIGMRVFSFDFEYLKETSKEIDEDNKHIINKFSRLVVEHVENILKSQENFFYSQGEFSTMNRLQAAAYMSLLKRDKAAAGS